MHNVTTLIRKLRSDSERVFKEALHLTTVANTLSETAYELECAMNYSAQ